MGTFAAGIVINRHTLRPVVGQVLQVRDFATDVLLAPDGGVVSTGAAGGYGRFVVPGVDSVTLVAPDGTRIDLVSVEAQEVAAAAGPFLAGAGVILSVSGTVQLPPTVPGGVLAYRAMSTTTFVARDFSETTVGPGVYILEASPGGWVVHEREDGTPFTPTTSPTLIADDFEVARSSIYGTLTPTGGAVWAKALSFLFGVGVGNSQMQTVGGVAYQSASVGAGAHIPVAGLDWRVDVGYDVSGAGAANAQVRAAARGVPEWSSTNRAQQMVTAVVRKDGEVRLEPHEDPPGTFTQLTLGTGAPSTGTLRLDVVGSTARVYVNGSQVGPSQTLATPQLTGSVAGFGTFEGGRATSFTATRL